MAIVSYIATTVHRTLLTFSVALLWPAVAWAVPVVPVQLTEGTLTLSSSFGQVNGSTLSAIGPNFSIGASSLPFGWLYPGCPLPCPAGSVFTVNTGGDFAGGGGVTYNGVSVPISDAGGGGVALAGWMVTADPISMPPLGSPFTVTESFVITYWVQFPVCTNDPSCWYQRFLIQGAGSGIATFSFAPSSNDPNSWEMTSGVYAIQTPEPGTWLLLATGAGALGWRRWRSPHLRSRPAA